MESSRRDFFIDMVVNGFIFKNKVSSPPVSPSYLKQVWDYLKQGLGFTVFMSEIYAMRGFVWFVEAHKVVINIRSCFSVQVRVLRPGPQLWRTLGASWDPKWSLFARELFRQDARCDPTDGQLFHRWLGLPSRCCVFDSIRQRSEFDAFCSGRPSCRGFAAPAQITTQDAKTSPIQGNWTILASFYDRQGMRQLRFLDGNCLPLKVDGVTVWQWNILVSSLSSVEL